MNLTIVLTLKGRENFTYRWMSYMNDMKCPYKILIADGGTDINLENHLMNYENYPNLRYEYIKYPADIDVDTFYSKFVDAIGKVETDYILLGDNDDFFLLEKIPEMIEFLEDNPSFSAARGLLVNLKVLDEKNRSVPRAVGEKYIATLVKAPGIMNEFPIDRIEVMCKEMSKYDYYSNWYAVTRTKLLVGIWQKLLLLSIKEVIILEIMTHTLLLEAGKIKIFDAPFYIRQSGTSSFGDTLVVNNSFLERCLINNSLTEISIVVENMMELETREDQIRVMKSIAAWLDQFLENIRTRNYLHEGRLSQLRLIVDTLPFIRLIAQKTNQILRILLNRSSIQKSIRLREIEPYVLVSLKQDFLKRTL